jgi:hypothetical protein
MTSRKDFAGHPEVFLALFQVRKRDFLDEDPRAVKVQQKSRAADPRCERYSLADKPTDLIVTQ